MPDVVALERLVEDVERASQMAEALKALAHPVRLRIMACLARSGELSVGELVRRLQVPQAVISQQLNHLRVHAHVRVRPQGAQRFYGLAVSESVDLLECLVRCCTRVHSRDPVGAGANWIA